MDARIKVCKALRALLVCTDAIERDVKYFTVVDQLLLEDICNVHLGRN